MLVFVDCATDILRLTVLIDTGASVSLLRRNVLDQIIQKTHRVHVLEKSGPLQGLGGMSLKVCGKTQISVAGIRSPLEVVVCDTLPHDMILGDTSLRNCRCIIDLANNELTWYSKKWPLKQHTKSGYASIGPTAPETGNSKINHLKCQNADCFSARGERIKTGTHAILDPYVNKPGRPNHAVRGQTHPVTLNPLIPTGRLFTIWDKVATLHNTVQHQTPPSG